MHIANPTWLVPLLLLFAVWLVYALYTLRRDKKDLELLGYQNLVLSPGMAWGRRVVRSFLLLAGFFLVLLGAVRPQGKPVPEDLNLRGIDAMVVLDVSKSMMSQDMVPNRLGAAKKALLSLLENREGDRVGLVVFAGEAVVQVPLTMDLEAVALVLDKADVGDVDKGGTDIGEGIRTALAAFPKDDQTKRGKAILLLTDGEITDGASNLEQACAEARKNNIPIVSVGMGTRQGKPIPDGVSFWGEANYKKDRSGRIYVSRLDEKTLGQIADWTGGVFVHGDSEEGLGSIQAAMDKLQKTQMKGQGTVRREELSPSLGALSAGALLLSALL
jgi:Ca-activated chloride channel family protein